MRRLRLQDRPLCPATRIGGNRHAKGERDVGCDGRQELRTLALETIGDHIRERQHILAIEEAQHFHCQLRFGLQVQRLGHLTCGTSGSIVRTPPRLRHEEPRIHERLPMA